MPQASGMDVSTRSRLDTIVQSHQVVLFMKGTRQAPQCGFSATVVGILDELVPEYETFNVLDDAAARDGIKEYSSWPTIPQLFIGGEFVGGCDIITELHGSGELHGQLGLSVEAVEAPEIEVSPRALEAFSGALEADEDCVRVQIDARFENELSVGPAGKGDLTVEKEGVRFIFDRGSARRSQGLSIDFVDTPQGQAFKLDNPNEPARVQQMTVEALKERMDAGQPLELFDVRTEQERATAVIEGARQLTEATQNHLFGLDRDTEVIFHCHHGGRSQAAAEHFLREGFKNVYNVAGGIDAWSERIDPKVPKY